MSSDRPIAGAAPGIVAEGNRLAIAPDHLRHVEVGALRGKSRFGTGDFSEQFAAHVRGRCPEFAVLGWPPARPQLIEGW